MPREPGRRRHMNYPQAAGRRGAAALQAAQRLELGALMMAQGEVVAPRARLAAVTKRLWRFWTRLQGLGRLISTFLTRFKVRRGPFNLLAVSVVQEMREKRPTPPVSPPPPPPLLEVNGEEVSRELQLLYKDYCKVRATCPKNNTACHMCFFHEQRWPNGIVPDSDMIIHCIDSHKGKCHPCGEPNCQVKVGSTRELELHIFFCHTLPADWWSQ